MTLRRSRFKVLRRRTVATFALFLSLGLLALGVAALMIGPESFSPDRLLDAMLNDAGNSDRIILFELRLPRILLAIGVGAALASTGAIFQALLKNPLAEPYILGISNGSAVGAMIAFWLGLNQAGVTALSFIGGGIVVWLVLWIGARRLGTDSDGMLLGGVMVAAMGAAVIFLFLYLLGAQARSAIQWMLGDLSSITPAVGFVSSGLFAALLGASFLVGNWLNTLALGEERAMSLGMDVRNASKIAYLSGSLVVGITVSFCGAIGFIGLVVPHVIRRLVGPDHRLLMPLTVIGGAIFLLICDTIARSLLPLTTLGGSELPVGAITALVGAPLFIHLLRNETKG